MYESNTSQSTYNCLYIWGDDFGVNCVALQNISSQINAGRTAEGAARISGRWLKLSSSNASTTSK